MKKFKFRLETLLKVTQRKIDAINEFLCQGIFEVDTYDVTERKLIKISGK